MKSGTTELIQLYDNYQKYLVNEMLYNVPTDEKGEKLKSGYLKVWNRKITDDIMKLEREKKRLGEVYKLEQISDSKTYYMLNIKKKGDKDATIRSEIETPELVEVIIPISEDKPISPTHDYNKKYYNKNKYKINNKKQLKRIK
jgi:hypothetical protein